MKATFLTNVLRGKTSVLTAMALAAMVASASAQSVANSSFSSVTTTAPATGDGNSQEISNGSYVGATVTGWTNGSGDYNIAMINGKNLVDDSFRANDFSLKGTPFAGSNGNFVALDSDFPQPSTLINPFSSTAGITGLTVGDTYTLSFQVATDEQSVINGVANTANNYDETLTVNIGGTNTPFTLHYTDANAGVWSTESINFPRVGKHRSPVLPCQWRTSRHSVVHIDRRCHQHRLLSAPRRNSSGARFPRPAVDRPPWAR